MQKMFKCIFCNSTLEELYRCYFLLRSEEIIAFFKGYAVKNNSINTVALICKNHDCNHSYEIRVCEKYKIFDESFCFKVGQNYVNVWQKKYNNSMVIYNGKEDLYKTTYIEDKTKLLDKCKLILMLL